NFSQAAIIRNVSQPAFSRRIRALEHAVGVELFNRQVSPLQLSNVYTAWEEMGKVRDALEAAGLKADSAEVSMIPSTKADMDAETAPKLLRLIDMLEDCDDVQEVYHNGEISDEVAATL
ncbi:YebC/PmpR family DNA-binding transcriptional regulator, partial [Salmonella enterica subsp. enterica serovar Kentucky]|nr:YebC/PmpR family DNA-binding transcriptional regulator [Salmonella enterica subsp. enterica serovar Kentucky]